MTVALAGAALWIPDYLSKWRVPFTLIPGWETRGRPGGRFEGVVNHHVGIAGDTPSPGLRIVTFGRADLRNALCNVHTNRPGTNVDVVAAGVAWHAGQGGWAGRRGNEEMLGNECEGTTGQPAPPRQYDLIVLTTAALLDGLRSEAGAACQHYEWTTRKQDMWAIRDPAAWRAAVARRLANGPDVDVDEEEEMLAWL